jgi:hypothetical protein
MAIALMVATIAGLAFVVVGWLSLQDKLPPNAIGGIRTPYTMKSPENWYATHRAAAPVLIWSGAAAVAAGLAFLPFAVAGVLDDRLAGGVTAALSWLLLAGAVGGWLYGTKVARSRND